MAAKGPQIIVFPTTYKEIFGTLGLNINVIARNLKESTLAVPGLDIRDQYVREILTAQVTRGFIESNLSLEMSTLLAESIVQTAVFLTVEGIDEANLQFEG